MKKVLVVSKGIVHPTIFCRMQLGNILKKVDDTEIKFTSDLNILDGIDKKTYHAVVLFFHEKTIRNSCLKSLKAYVENGGVLFCLHGALASFKKLKVFKEMIGAKFTGHDEIKDIHLEGIMEFTVKDELYEFEIAKDCDVHLHCQGIPVYWTRDFRKGRVACFSLGHRAKTFRNKDFRKLIISILTDELDENEAYNEED